MKKQSFTANTNKQPLEEHLAGVAIASELILNKIVREEEIKSLRDRVVLGALVHDIGKCAPDFQSYLEKISKKKNGDLSEENRGSEGNFVGPFHNEISLIVLKSLKLSSGYLSDEMIFSSEYLSYWHHGCNFDNKKDEIRFNTPEKVFDEFVKNQIKVDNSFNYEEFISNCLEVYEKAHSLWSANSSLPKTGIPATLGVLRERVEQSLSNATLPQYKPYKVGTKGIRMLKEASEETLILTIMIEADKFVSKMSPEELSSFIHNPKLADLIISNFLESIGPRPDIKNNRKIPIDPTNLSKERVIQSLEQEDIARKASRRPLSVCGIDPSGGKTSISLLWWEKNLETTPKKLFFVLPRQHQVISLFSGVKKDALRIFGRVPSIQSFHSGEVKLSTEDEQIGSTKASSSDINIMVFDRLILGLYDHNKTSELFCSFVSNLVIDEFHEFNQLPKMIPGLGELLFIRRNYLKNASTLLLSGTPDIELLKICLYFENDDFVLNRDLMTPQNKKVQLVLSDKYLQETELGEETSSLITFSRICDAQKFKSQKEFHIAHSNLVPNEKERRITSILEENGEANFLNENPPVVSSKMFQSSFDMCFRKIHAEISLPFTDIQTLGRNNRFGKREDATYTFYNSQNKDIYNKNCINNRKTHDLWIAHVKKVVAEFNNERIQYREVIVKLFDDFFKDKSNQDTWRGELLDKVEGVVSDLKQIIPRRRGGVLNKNTKNIKQKINNRSLRGSGGLYVTAPVFKDGVFIGWLGTSDEYPLLTSNLSKNDLNKYSTKSEAIYRSGKTSEKNFVSGILGVEFNKYKKIQIGSSEELPIILCDDIDNYESLKSRLYYDDKLGLVLGHGEEIEE